MVFDMLNKLDVGSFYLNPGYLGVYLGWRG
jgi:hypothetical protein